ncbi:alanine racemase, N- domain protein [Treponema primitia ZAS-2]|uniref:Alanine racemase, N-domain protein n=1 Tax=Treponema primitia (strain ATCC BAA-887 / DSM 12427 / ZAS-2) TaxID=545694 RepID=F5YQS6_TREPZ|nr:ornithine racemase Orr [Treponema primitia]AEF86084.1 alanine racemase, N- domain protein [Treponema primitia ZAS-2]
MAFDSTPMDQAAYPLLSINIGKLRQNLETLSASVKGSGCSLMIVTKSFCADPEITEMLLSHSAVDYLADSRIKNIKTYAGSGKKTVLLRLPQKCEIPDVIRCTDVSMNSEIETLGLLNDEAARQGKIHQALLMIDLGDLREGLFYKEEEKILRTVDEISRMKHLELLGLGTNLTCYGAIIPKMDNLSILVSWADRIHEHFGIKPAIVSGGNSSSYYLIEKGEIPQGINNLRLGESFVLGTETAYGSRIENTYSDGVKLEAQIIEVQTKPSLPEGESGKDAFGKCPVFKDLGLIKRAILAVGKQDVDTENMFPEDLSIAILGASSDHLILDISASEKHYQVGDVVAFTLKYSALLRAFSSGYVQRRYIEGIPKSPVNF